MRLFAKKKKAPTPQETITKMRETLEMLEKRERHLQNKMNNELADAKKYMAAKNKRAAMMCLKRKKAYETQIEKMSGARMTIDTQLMAIEGANASLETMNVMKMGAQTMRAIHNNLTVEDVDNTMEEIQEQLTINNEINEAISNPIVGINDYDEDELNAELEELEQENLDQQFLNMHAPAAPVAVASPGKVQQQQQQVQQQVQPLSANANGRNTAATAPVVDEEAELRALEESMSL